jgi:hypothetical protein
MPASGKGDKGLYEMLKKNQEELKQVIIQSQAAFKKDEGRAEGDPGHH